MTTQINIAGLVDSIARIHVLPVTIPASGSPFASSQTFNVRYVKIGSLVTMHFPAILVAANAVAANSAASAAGTLPIHLYPLENDVFIVAPVTLSNGTATTTPGNIALYTDGHIAVIFGNGINGTWGMAGNNGWLAFSFSYLTP